VWRTSGSGNNSCTSFACFVIQYPTSPRGMAPVQPKIFMYRYLDEDELIEEEETDLTGEIELPRRGDIIYRRDQCWKVVAIYTVGAGEPFPRFRIHLTNMSKSGFVN